MIDERREDEMLRSALDERNDLEDDGFTERVLQRLPKRRSRRRGPLLAVFAIAALAVAAIEARPIGGAIRAVAFTSSLAASVAGACLLAVLLWASFLAVSE